jgi:hypothetical protein
MIECLDDCDELDKHVDLLPHQLDAIDFLDNGKILYGPIGSGKSAVALGYYMKNEQPRDIYVITTAKKRDSLEWTGEAARYGIGTESDATLAGVLRVDSWNSISNYLDIEDAFFVFDEQRLVGHGTWVKSFLKIAKKNRWILLSATPGDIWMDYAPVFIANGWYKNITDFKRQHVVYAPWMKFPVILRYLGESKLERLRNEILVEMPYEKHTKRIMNFLDVGYDEELWKYVVKNRWNIYEDRPIKDVAELYRVTRRIVNSDPSRLEMVLFLMKAHPKLIIFYNYDYELEILRTLCVDTDVAEWNGHRKHPIPDTDRWVYLVQYISGAEGWNCTDTDAMILYSLPYSYKAYVQSQGRIDRMDTKFTNLYYYVLGSASPFCRGVKKSLDKKKSFNERKSMIFGE